MSDQKNDKNATQEWPTLTENHWYALAVTSAIFTALCIVTAFAFIFGDGFDADSDLQKAQALAPFGVALFALVTFCTVAWRGSVNVRQANQAEREGRAKLLQEGAKLLGEAANPSHVSAGIATLEILITGQDERVAIQSMNLVADFIQREMQVTHHHPFREEAFAALASGGALGRLANRSLIFDSQNNDKNIYWTNIDGVKHVSFKGGLIGGGILGGFEDRENYRYTECQIYMMNINLSDRFNRCNIKYCGINSVGFFLYHKDFAPTIEESNFSGAKFTTISQEFLDHLAIGRNYFNVANPPTTQDGSFVEWGRYLEARRP